MNIGNPWKISTSLSIIIIIKIMIIIIIHRKVLHERMKVLEKVNLSIIIRGNIPLNWHDTVFLTASQAVVIQVR